MTAHTSPAKLQQRIRELERLNDMHKAAWAEWSPFADYIRGLLSADKIPPMLGHHLGDVARCAIDGMMSRIADLTTKEFDLVAERDDLRARHLEITLNAAQLRHALEFIAPDFDRDTDQHESEVTIGWREAGAVVDDDGKPEPAGYVAWLSDYPEEGCIPLLETWPTSPAPAIPDGCGACGDACKSRQSCRLSDESPEAAR